MQWASPDQASKTWYNANRGPSRPPRKSEGLRCFVCMKTCKCRSWFILPWDLEGEICQHGTNLCGLTACVHSAKQDECQASCGRRAPQQKSQTLTPEASCRGKTRCLGEVLTPTDSRVAECNPRSAHSLEVEVDGEITEGGSPPQSGLE